MDYPLAALAGLFLTAAVYLLLSRALVRMLLGLVLLGNAVNLVILVGGRLSRLVPPLALDGTAPAVGAANPLPQALILTAIVISFAMFAFLLVLTWRAYRTLAADDTDRMRVAEPPGRPEPPMSY